MPVLTMLAAAAATCLSPAVHDGDSIRCGRERIRIVNIDAPEVAGSPKCEAPRRPRSAWCDYAAGEQARRALAQLLAGRQVTIVRTGADDYGRTLAYVRAGNIDAGEWLVSQRLARRWH